MKDYSVKQMLKYENIRLRQLVYLCNLIARTKLNNLEYLKGRFLEQFEHFDETLEFLLYYKLIGCENKKISFTPKMERILAEKINNAIDGEAFKKFFSKLIIDEESDLKTRINEFVSKFEIIGDRYVFKPTGKYRIESGTLRNFLIDFGIIDLCRNQSKYFLSKSATTYLKINKERLGFDDDQFKVLLSLRSKIGQKAEIEVMNYEHARLKSHKEHFDKIEHTSLLNVGAGYDIKSFDFWGSKIHPRYIEVKAISFLDSKFFWSSNEIQCAQLKKKEYFLYLVPIGKKSEVLIHKMQIIQNPYKHIFKHKSVWNRKIELMSFEKKRSYII